MGRDYIYVNERPEHQVNVQAFLIARTHVTVGQFTSFVNETGYEVTGNCRAYDYTARKVRNAHSWQSPGFSQDADHPVVCVSWNDAKAFAGWLSHKTGKTYRLPTDAEWEYAARAGLLGAYFWGFFDVDDACKHANVYDNTGKNLGNPSAPLVDSNCSDGFIYTSPVGRFLPNAFGLYDMVGNAQQWTDDCYHESYVGAPTDGGAWNTGNCVYRVLRGSAWNEYSEDARISKRFYGERESRSFAVGFRLARDIQ